MKDLLHTAITAALKGAKEVMDVYSAPSFEIEIKSDNSPVTIADKRSNDVIEEILLASGIPVLSEESEEIPFAERRAWKKFWVVDPLDGTRQFIKRNGQFTINVGLADEHGPSLGVIYVPVTGEIFFSTRNNGAYKAIIDADDEAALVLNKAERLLTRKDIPAVVAMNNSSAHSHRMEAFLSKVREDLEQEPELFISGSALKFGVVAEGRAGFYPRFKPSMEWDTAAGHAIVKEVGFSVYDADSGEELKYNKSSLLNPSFIVCREGYF